MSCHSNKIVRVTYPKNCCPEVDDSQQLLYNGPALSCIGAQTGEALNSIIKELDTLICQTINELTPTPPPSTTTTTTTKACKNVFLEILDKNPFDTICFSIGLEMGGIGLETLSPSLSPSLHNGKVWYGDLNAIAIYWSSSLNKWVCDIDGLDYGTITQTLDNNNNDLPISSSIYQWTPDCSGAPVTPICTSLLGSCSEEMCFAATQLKYDFGFSTKNDLPESTKVNGRVWYKFQFGVDPEYFYVYWDNSSTYLPGGTWVVGVSLNGALTPPLSSTDIWAYLPYSYSYPADTINIPSQYTVVVANAPGDFQFAALRGSCSNFTTTTSTTTIPPNLIRLTPANSEGFFGLSMERISGVNPDNLIFSMQLDRHAASGCTGGSGSYSFNPSLDAGESFDFDGVTSSNLNLSARIVSLTVNGNPITTSPQTITVNGTNYVIEGFNVCTLL